MTASATRTPISVVVPAYQESDSIAPTLGRLVDVLEGTGRLYEVVVVSDGSTDGTADIARGLALPGVRVLEYHPNQGKGHALRTGFRDTVHPIVAFLDGDLDLDPCVLPGFFDTIDSGVADVVVGSKVHPQSQVAYPLTRRLASRTFRVAVRAMVGIRIKDTQTGVKAMRRVVAVSAVDGCTLTGFAFDLELMCRLVDDGARVLEAPVVLNYTFATTVDASSALEAFRDLRTVARARRHRAAESVSARRAVDL